MQDTMKMKEEKLKDSETKYRLLCDNASNTLLIHDGGEQILAINHL